MVNSEHIVMLVLVAIGDEGSQMYITVPLVLKFVSVFFFFSFFLFPSSSLSLSLSHGDSVSAQERFGPASSKKPRSVSPLLALGRFTEQLPNPPASV